MMKKSILETAFLLFLKNGFAEVSTNEIIREAKTTKGCFYHYFKSREDLIYHVIVTYVYPYLESPVKALQQWEKEQEELDVLEAIHFCYTYMPKLTMEIGENVSFREMQFLIYEGIKKYNYLEKKSCKCSQEQRFLLKELLEKGKQQKVIDKRIDANSYATTMIALKDGIVALHILDSSIDTKEKWESTFQVIWSEIKEVPQIEKSDRGGYFYARAAL